MEFQENFKFIRKKITRGFVYYLTLLGTFATSFMPLEVGRVLGRFLGEMAYYLLRSERRKTLAHLKFAFRDELSPSEIKRIAKSCFSNLGESFFDMLIIPRRFKKNKDANIEVEGLEFFEECLKEGKGTIIVTAHISSWELFAWTIASLGHDLGVVAKDINNDGVNRILVDFRKKNGVKTFLRNDPNVTRKIIKHLKNNGVLGILIDQDTRVDGVFVDFFGHPANTPRGQAMLAVSVGSPILAGFIVREGMGYKIKFEKPITIQHGLDKDTKYFQITAELTRIIEKYVRMYPEQWVWMHRRWRRKKGENND